MQLTSISLHSPTIFKRNISWKQVFLPFHLILKTEKRLAIEQDIRIKSFILFIFTKQIIHLSVLSTSRTGIGYA